MQLSTIILLFFTSLRISSTIINIQKKISLPPHQYKIELIEGFSYTITVSWNDESDLDAYIYKHTSRQLQRSYQQRTGFVQSFTYDPESTEYYSVRIKPVMIKQKVVCYSIKISANEIEQKLLENCILEDHQDSSAFIVGLESSKVISIKYQTSQTTQVEYYCFNDLGPYSGTPHQTYWITAQCSNRVIVLLKENLPQNFEQFFVFMEVTQLNTQCEPGYIFNNQKNECIYQSADLNTKIIFIVIGSIGGVTILVLLAVVLRKKCKQQEGQDEGVRGACIQPVKRSKQNVQESLQKIKEAQFSTCPICLDEHCDVKLQCNHFYHKSCINDWLERNNHCPLCRQDFRKSKIRVVR